MEYALQWRGRHPGPLSAAATNERLKAGAPCAPSPGSLSITGQDGVRGRHLTQAGAERTLALMGRLRTTTLIFGGSLLLISAAAADCPPAARFCTRSCRHWHQSIKAAASHATHV